MATTHKNKVELIDYLIEMLSHVHLRMDLRENLLEKSDGWCLELISLIDNHTNHGIQKEEVIIQEEWHILTDFNTDPKWFGVSTEIIERELDKLQPLIADGRLLGQLGQPSGMDISLKDASHLITELEWYDRVLSGKIRFLDTPKGPVAKKLINQSLSWCFQPRVIATMRAYEVPDINILTWDIVPVGENFAEPHREDEMGN